MIAKVDPSEVENLFHPRGKSRAELSTLRHSQKRKK